LEQKAAKLTLAQRQSAPLFLPYLSGERTPHNNAQVRGSFHGLGFETDAAQLAFGVMEGVSFGLRDGLLALQAAGCTVKQLSLVGGGARSTMWAQQLASALGIDIVTHGSSIMGGALGAARLSWLATGAPEAMVCVAPPIDAVYAPDADEHAVLMARHQRFTQLYRMQYPEAPNGSSSG
jgi:xylulokinase